MSIAITRIHYRADKPGKKTPYYPSPYAPFGAYCVSLRVQGLMLKIGKDTAALAKAMVPASDDPRGGHYRDKFGVQPGPHIKVQGLSRATSQVYNTARNAVAVEFGSGYVSAGDSGGQSRPQGGWSKPKRPLGRAGAIMGDWHPPKG